MDTNLTDPFNRNSDCGMTDEEKVVLIAIALSIAAGIMTWEIASLFFDASPETAIIIGSSTTGCILLVSIVAAIYYFIYMHNKEGNSVRNDAAHETTGLAESAALLSREAFEAPEPALSKKPSIASMLTVGYGATSPHVVSPYASDTPELDVTSALLQP